MPPIIIYRAIPLVTFQTPYKTDTTKLFSSRSSLRVISLLTTLNEQYRICRWSVVCLKRTTSVSEDTRTANIRFYGFIISSNVTEWKNVTKYLQDYSNHENSPKSSIHSVIASTSVNSIFFCSTLSRLSV